MLIKYINYKFDSKVLIVFIEMFFKRVCSFYLQEVQICQYYTFAQNKEAKCYVFLSVKYKTNRSTF